MFSYHIILVFFMKLKGPLLLNNVACWKFLLGNNIEQKEVLRDYLFDPKKLVVHSDSMGWHFQFIYFYHFVPNHGLKEIDFTHMLHSTSTDEILPRFIYYLKHLLRVSLFESPHLEFIRFHFYIVGKAVNRYFQQII